MIRTNYVGRSIESMQDRHFFSGLVAGLLLGLVLVLSASVSIPGFLPSNGGKVPLAFNTSRTSPVNGTAPSSYIIQTANGTVETLFASATVTSTEHEGTVPNSTNYSASLAPSTPASVANVAGVPSSFEAISAHSAQDDLIVVIPLVVAAFAGCAIYMAVMNLKKEEPEPVVQ